MNNIIMFPDRHPLNQARIAILRRELRGLATLCVENLNLFFDLSAEKSNTLSEEQRLVARGLLENMTVFFQTKNTFEGDEEWEGLDVHPYLVSLRKIVLLETDVPVLPPLPPEVYAALE